MILRKLFSRSGADPVAALYGQLVAQARQPGFYTACAVPDTVQGRFEMIALHAFLVMRRLKTGGAADRLAQDLFDLMFADMDRNLRELGTGDLGVAKRIKKLAKAFYGRIAAYEDGLGGAVAGRLEEALARNAYEEVAAPSAAVALLADYLRRADAALAEQGQAELAAGRVRFPAPPAAV
ncbi:MAG TPA: ubiquinol-cytochrome C chaperone family protein [Alphaproteobacteria bacterium]|nr:ubiquinol-cytochrome C chaperone family protein [Alphaproteobacteria bacterium]